MRLVRQQDGSVAIEFGLVAAPFLAGTASAGSRGPVRCGVHQLTSSIHRDRKVTLTTRTVADLTSQVTTVTSTEIGNILGASAQVIMPYDASKLKATVSQVKIDANSAATIDWSCTLNGSKRSTGASVTLPAALNVASTYLIWSEVSYSYKPTIGYVVTGTLNLSDQIYMRPRQSTSVTLSGSC
jgi:Flp pilus assembly protein TadG